MLSDLNPNAASAPPKSRRRRRDKVTAILSANQSVSFTAEKVTFDGMISMLEELLGKAKKAQASGMRLKTFLLVLEDQNLGAEE